MPKTFKRRFFEIIPVPSFTFSRNMKTPGKNHHLNVRGFSSKNAKKRCVCLATHVIKLDDMRRGGYRKKVCEVHLRRLFHGSWYIPQIVGWRLLVLFCYIFLLLFVWCIFQGKWLDNYLSLLVLNFVDLVQVAGIL